MRIHFKGGAMGSNGGRRLAFLDSERLSSISLKERAFAVWQHLVRATLK